MPLFFTVGNRVVCWDDVKQERGQVADYTSSEPLPAKAVANYFLDKAKNAHRPLTPMKLQKLVYIAHGWHLALFDASLIRERVQAWRWGPVIEDLYHEFKEFAKQPITRKAGYYSFDDFVIKRRIPEIHFVDGDSDRTRHFSIVCGKYIVYLLRPNSLE